MQQKAGVEHLVLIGFLQSRFNDLCQIHHWMNQLNNAPISHLAPGLHPFYIEEHHPQHLLDLEHILKHHQCVAVGEIGLDTFLKQHKQPEILQKQKDFFQHKLIWLNNLISPFYCIFENLMPMSWQC